MLGSKIYFAEDLVPIMRVAAEQAESLGLEVTRARCNRLADELDALAEHEAYVGQQDITPGSPMFQRVEEALGPLSGDVRVRAAIAGSSVLTGTPTGPQFASPWLLLGVAAVVGVAFFWTHKGKVW